MKRDKLTGKSTKGTEQNSLLRGVRIYDIIEREISRSSAISFGLIDRAGTISEV